jgi:Tfp pilus assembly protein PilX
MRRIRSQRGATLVIALIMLVLLTLFALSALNTGTTNLKVVGNMQARTEALDAAQQTIENVISTPLFTSSPGNAILNPSGAANTLCTDAAGNWVADCTTAAYKTLLNPQPACVTVRAIKSTELVLTNPADLACAGGQAQQFGVAGAVTGDSLCANSVWEITAETTVVATGVNAATVTQGIGIRISTDDMATSCL